MPGNIMIQGTMSGVGKSLLVAALCRIFREDGIKAAPFKSQNMALNSYITEDGLEMGRAQAVQARAAGILPDVRMNPILLKPSSDTGSQLIVNGRVHGQYSAREYFGMKRALVPEILKAYESLKSEYDVVVIEGAGSPAEINLRKDDIVNMGLAEMVDAPVILVGDIDRGGVFAQLYGTMALLQKEEKCRVIGTLINKFRGDVTILKPGLKELESLTGVPVLGVVPYLRVDIDEEDSLSDKLDGHTQQGLIDSEKLDSHIQRGLIDIAVIRLPHISNYTDFEPLSVFPAFSVRYVRNVNDLKTPDFIILPGTKNTMGDLKWLKESGLMTAVMRRHGDGTPVLGICGGYQMLGESLSDPMSVEYGGEMQGLGLLPVQTSFSPEKTQRQIHGVVPDGPFAGAEIEGYEIHMGKSIRVGGKPFSILSDGSEDGAVCGDVCGTYLHGLFDSGELTEKLAGELLKKRGISMEEIKIETHREYEERQLSLLAEGVRKAINLEAIKACL